MFSTGINTLIKQGSHILTPRNGVITFSFVSGANQVSAGVQDNVRHMFKQLIEPYINVRFVETASNGDITFQLTNRPNVYAYAQEHDVFLSRSNDHQLSNSGFQRGVGSYGFMTLIHETLHAMGLMHPGNYNGATGSSPGPYLPYALDNTTNSLMSYNTAGAGASTPMPYDIAALQSLYGTKNLNGGNTTYRFTSAYSFNDGQHDWGSVNAPSKLTLWDRTGNDTVDFSQVGYSSSGYVLDLRAGGILTTGTAYNGARYNPKDAGSILRDFFDLDGDGDRLEIRSITHSTSTYGTALGLGTNIERVIGSNNQDIIMGGTATRFINGLRGDDYIFGNIYGDTIVGGYGQDIIHGNGGNDLLIGGNNTTTARDWFGHDTLLGGAGNDRLVGEDGNDTLRGQQHNDVLIGGSGSDYLAGSEVLVSSDIDQLYGGSGFDRFVLGDQRGSFYQGSGYAIIRDWEPYLDKIQLGQSIGQYTTKTLNLIGGAAQDTAIYHNNDLIGIVQDSTNVRASRGDFVFA